MPLNSAYALVPSGETDTPSTNPGVPIAVIAAVLTPGPDVASQMLLAAPLTLLYVVSIGVACTLPSEHASPAELIRHPHDVLAVLREPHTQGTVGVAGGVVIGTQCVALGAEDRDDRIQR